METIKKFCMKKYLYIATIVSGVLGIILFFTATSIGSSSSNMSTFSDLGSIVSTIKNFCNLFYLVLIILVMIVVGYCIRLFSMKDHSLDSKILLGGNATALLFALISASTISSIKSLVGGDFSSIYGAADLESQMKMIGVMILVQVGFAIYAGILLYKNKGKESVATAEDGESTSTDASASKESEGPTLVDDFKAYYATEKGKKTVRIVGAVIGVIVILLICINVYSSMKRTPIDLTKNCEVSFSGVSGEGNANINCSPDYDINNESISAFVKDVSYTVENNGNLKNGDKAVIKAKYSEATADSSKVEVKNPTKKVAVKGLEVAYKKFKDVPKSVSSKFEAAAKQKLETTLKGDGKESLFGPKSVTLDEIEFIGSYYEYSSYNTSGTAYYVYRTKMTKEYSYSIDKKVYYYYVSIDEINSREELDLESDSDDIDYNEIYVSSDEKNDKTALKKFKDSHSNVEVIKETPGTETYTDESIDKE